MTDLNIAGRVKGELERVAQNPSFTLQPEDVDRVAQRVTQVVQRPVEALAENLTNREPWYRSRVILGLGVALAAKAAEQFLGVTMAPGDEAELTGLVLDGITWAGSIVALWGRLAAKPAIGR